MPFNRRKAPTDLRGSVRTFSVNALATVLLLCVTFSIVRGAPNDRPLMDNMALLQYLLIWTGDYVGMVDGIAGPLTETAVQRYEARAVYQSERLPPGSPAPGSGEALIHDAVKALLVFDFVLLRDKEIGVVYGVPRSIFRLPRKIDRRNTVGLSFQSPDASVDLEVMRLTNRERSLTELYNRLVRLKNRDVTYEVVKGDWFIVSGTEGSRNFYARFDSSSGNIRGFSFSYERSRSDELGRVAVAMSNVFRPEASANDPLIAFIEGLQVEMEVGASGQGPHGNTAATTESSGSGFIVDSKGHIVSNAHVVENCREVRIGDRAAARVIAADRENDLALLESSETLDVSALVFRSDAIKLGEEVVAAGYPLHGVLADSLNITVGVVSSLSGLGNDDRFVQTTAAIQPGNSGGPLVDRNARVVGIVTAKLRAQEMFEMTGVVPEGVNFAIRHGQVRNFLKAQGLSPKVSRETLEPQSVQEVAEVIQKSVVPVICLAH